MFFNMIDNLEKDEELVYFPIMINGSYPYIAYYKRKKR